MSESTVFASLRKRDMSAEEWKQLLERRKAGRRQITLAMRAAKAAERARLWQAKVQDRAAASAMRRMFAEEEKQLKRNSTKKRAVRKPRVQRQQRQQPDLESAELNVTTLDLPTYEVNAPVEPEVARAALREYRGPVDLSAQVRKQSQLSNEFRILKRKVKYWRFNGITSVEDIRNALVHVYESSVYKFRFHMRFDTIWEARMKSKQANEDGVVGNRYEYFSSRNNKHPFEFVSTSFGQSDRMVTIQNRADLDAILEQLTHERILNNLSTDRGSDVRPIYVYQVEFKVAILDTPFGSHTKLPDYLVKSRNIVSLVDVEDGDCFWAARALASGARRDRFLSAMKRFKAEWLEHTKNRPRAHPGMTIEDIEEYERDVNTEVAVYLINITAINNGVPEYDTVYVSPYRDERPRMYLNKFLDHVSYISCFTPVEKAYTCTLCGHKFRDEFNLKRHMEQSSCKGKKVNHFPIPEDCIYNKDENLVYTLCRRYGVQEFVLNDGVKRIELHARSAELSAKQADLYKYPYMVMYDCEVMLVPTENNGSTNTQLVAKHVPITVALSTNIPNCPPFDYDGEGIGKLYIFDKDPRNLVRRMFEALDVVTNKGGRLMLEKLAPLIEVLEQQGDEGNLLKVHRYATGVPVLGFNNGKYDNNLLKKHGFIEEVIKRKIGRSPILEGGGRYKQIALKTMVFQDAMLFAAPGTTLKGFINAYSDKSELRLRFPFKLLDKNSHNLKLKISTLTPEHFELDELGAKSEAEREHRFVSVMQECTRLGIWDGTLRTLFVYYRAQDEGKFVFPYEILSSLEVLERSVNSLVAADFYSRLRAVNMLADDDELQKALPNAKVLWTTLGFEVFELKCRRMRIWESNIARLLEVYNLQDVVPFLKACIKQREMFYTFNMELHKDAVTLSSASQKILCRFMWKPIREKIEVSRDMCCEQHRIDVGNGELAKRLEVYRQQDERGNRGVADLTVGGMREIFAAHGGRCFYCAAYLINKCTSHQRVSKECTECPRSWTLDRLDNKRAHDRDNLVLCCLGCNRARAEKNYFDYYEQHLTSMYDRPIVKLISSDRTKEGDKKANLLLEKLKKNIVGGPSLVFYRMHRAGVTQINKLTYDEEKCKFVVDTRSHRLCYRILGFDANALYLWCFAQEMLCGDLKFVEESDWAKYEKLVLSDEFFGCCEVDIEIPKKHWNKFCDFPPLFFNTEVASEMCGEFTLEMFKKLGEKHRIERKLVSGFAATKTLLITPLLKWLLEHGAKVTKLYGVIKSERGKTFAKFSDYVSDGRRMGDVCGDKVLADTNKIIGNSAFGGTLLNLDKHTDTKFAGETEYSKYINTYWLKDVEEHDCEPSAKSPNGRVYEFTLGKKSTLQKTPLQVGFAILQYAKLRMLQFYYDCVLKLVPQHEIQTIHMDTDSIYIAVSERAYHVLKGTKKAKYFGSEAEATRIRAEFFPRTDKDVKIKLADGKTEMSVAKYDARTPGLFKLECEANGEIALTAKTNFILGVRDDEGNLCDKNKVTCKGGQKQRNENNLTWEKYEEALCKNETIVGENSGFRMNNKTMYTYTVSKKILTPVYTKAVLLDDGIHVRPFMPDEIERMASEGMNKKEHMREKKKEVKDTNPAEPENDSDSEPESDSDSE